jgi:serine/threonine protein kinase/tetratricopeptide (TPR) repeat protein
VVSLVGQTISHYKILEKLGEGGMGVVYKAQDLKLDRPVALKFLPPELTWDADAKERFVHEAKAASALEHSAICNIHEIGETDDGQLFIVMACYEGETLKAKLEDGYLDIDPALDIAIQIAEGLSRAHEAGIVHRDIKPANIMVTSRAEVKILDFGLAKLSGRTLLTRAGTTLGTAAYMSPEQARSETVDVRTDVWSLGVVLYEMLAGRRPFESDYEQALIYSILNETPEPLRTARAEVPEVVEQIVAKAMAKAKEERYQKIDDLLSDLKVARGTAEAGGTIAVAEAMERKRRKRLIRKLSIAGAALLIVAGGLFILAPMLQDQAIASNPRTIAFISFENQTGDKSFDNLQMSIPNLLTVSLDESRFFRVLTWDRIRGDLRRMGKGDVQFIDREIGLEVCRRAGIQALGMGTFTKAGELFLTNLQIIDVSSGEPITQSLRADGQGVESLLKSQVDDLAKQVSRSLGISRWGTGTSLKPVQQVTAASSEAYSFYVRGEYEFDRMHWKDAVRHFELAVKYDSTFASAWNFLSIARDFAAQNASGDPSGIEPAQRKALQYASRASEREQWHIAALGDSALSAKLMGEPVNRRWVLYWQKCLERFPEDARAHQKLGLLFVGRRRFAEAIEHFTAAAPVILQSKNLLVYAYMYSNQPEKAIEACKQYALAGAGEDNTFDTMGECLWYAGKFDEAIAQFKKAIEVNPEGTYGSKMAIAQLHFLKEEYDDALDWFDRAGNTWWRAYTLVWLGRTNEAERELRKMKGNPQAAWLEAWIAYEAGTWVRTRALLHRWAQEYPSPDEGVTGEMFVDYCLGLVDLKQGKMDSVEMRLASMKSKLTLARSGWDSVNIPLSCDFFCRALRAAYFLASGRAAEIDAQWSGGSTPWPVDLDPSHGIASRPVHPWQGPRYAYWMPIPCDIVPQAYLERGMPDSAIAAYEMAVDKKADFVCPIIPRYYYRLAQLYEQKGTREKAIDNYSKFLKVWGKSDPIFREPADARARLARLRRG